MHPFKIFTCTAKPDHIHGPQSQIIKIGVYIGYLFVVNVLGKVRIGKVKSTSNELVNKYGNAFTTDFDVNKKLVPQYSDITSKRLSNRVAGYITRLKVNQKKRDDAEAAEAAEVAGAEGEVVEVPAALAEEAGVEAVETKAEAATEPVAEPAAEAKPQEPVAETKPEEPAAPAPETTESKPADAPTEEKKE